jgi:cobalt-zinc-cadmium efflux system protein
MWWIQCLIWVSVTGFMLAGVMFSADDFDFKEGMMLFSIFIGLFPAIGVVINTATALLFMRGQHDLNVRGAFLHMMADAGVSAAVVIAAGLMLLTGGLQWLDPVLSLGIVAVILAGAWGLLKESAAMAMDAAPPGIDPAEVRAFLASRPGVAEVHDLHIWSLSTTRVALTAHLVRPAGEDPDAFLSETSQALAGTFGIHHATLQVETGTLDCHLAPDEVV